MAQSKKHQGKSRSKLTREQRAARVKAAEERERRAEQQRERAARTKKIFTVVVCVILVLALGIPTMALTVLSL
ncbi:MULTISPECIES: CASC3 protein CASC3 [unclassified Adlercreutzia]|uniref:CASC3 protein CASC3 n=1 Tax=unclassified Adlercreutzia TaxID=2636013 RepID=UPI0013EA7F39|nr:MULTISPECIES: CASC3 protein CASC3 [unclassified Adlercreutzia]